MISQTKTTAADDRELDVRFEYAQEIVRQAGDSTLTLFQSSDLHVDLKADRSPVTAADRNAEQLLRRAIGRRFPDDAVLGEEFGSSDGKSGFRWVLDPIDGTKSFICGVPLYGTMVAVEFEQRSVIGVIYFPALNEIVYAADGRGCFWKSSDHGVRPGHVSAKSVLSDCTLVTSDAKAFAKRNAKSAYACIEDRVRLARTWGDCFGYCLVATGAPTS